MQKVCDRVAIIDQGKLKRIGTAQDLGKQLFETQMVNCRLLNPISDAIIQQLTGIEGVENVRQNGVMLDFFVTDPDQVTPEIVRYLASSGADVLEVTRQQHTLEDIYLKLMRTDSEAVRINLNELDIRNKRAKPGHLLLSIAKKDWF